MIKPAKQNKIAYRTRNITKVYGSGEATIHALRGVDVEIPDGEFVVLLGASGSGKTTLLNILGGLDRVTEGNVYFFDADLTTKTERELTHYRRENVGFVFQAYNLMPSLTALENVELVTEISENPMDPAEALSIVGLGDRVHHFPSELSGGEQQRVAIARAIAKNPEVLFCDEPTGALDSVTGRSVLNALQDVNKKLGSLVVIITHATATAAMADRVIYFQDGQIQKITVNKTKLSADDIKW